METHEGISGWGEAYTMRDRDRNIAQHVSALSRYLIGRDPFHIKHFTQIVYNDFAGRRGAIDLFCALSGIEQALWDIVGKKLGTPIYNLLGGPCRDRIRVYANGWTTNGSWNSTTVSLAATLQVAAVIPNFLITEYFVNFTEPGNAILENAFEMVDGCFKLPTAPGLGITINEDALKRFAYQESSARQFRSIKQE